LKKHFRRRIDSREKEIDLQNRSTKGRMRRKSDGIKISLIEK